MTLTFINLNRFTSPSGVCVAVCNFITCISKDSSISKIDLVIGNWQVGYYKEKLKIDSISKVNIIGIDAKNTSIGRNRWFLFEMKRMVNAGDVVVMGYPIPFFRSSFKSPVVSILHDLFAFDYPQNFGFPAYYLNRAQFYLNLRSTSGYICVSETTKKSLLDRFGSKLKGKNIQTIYNFIPVKHEFQKPRFETDVEKYWLCVAQHRKNKNLDLLIKVYNKALVEKLIDEKVRLIIVGSEGPTTMEINALIESNGLKGKVILTSNLRSNEIAWLFKNTSLFVIPSSIEGFGMPLIEASRYTDKIVASDIPIFRELVENITFFKLEGNMENSLFEAVKKCISNIPLHPIVNPALDEQVIIDKFSTYLSSVVSNK